MVIRSRRAVLLALLLAAPARLAADEPGSLLVLGAIDAETRAVIAALVDPEPG